MKIFQYTTLVTGLMIFCISFSCMAQFAPPAGQPGSTAIFADSSVFIGWATGCKVHPGYIQISDTNKVYDGDNRASYGTDSSALGKADNNPLSLGDGGYAILTFEKPIMNGPGFDFAVFENGLVDTFLELAFVEVSSDGEHFFRFPAISNTQTKLQVSSFGTLDATKLNNLAGKYRVLFGTPFDLDEMAGIDGLDIKRVTHVKIIDVVGCIQTAYATLDSRGNVVNDPWPTAFNTSGFDLDAVGVIHFAVSNGDNPVFLYPNPVLDLVTVNILYGTRFDVEIHDASGKKVWNKEKIPNNSTLSLGFLSAGIYFCTFTLENGNIEVRKLVRQ